LVLFACFAVLAGTGTFLAQSADEDAYRQGREALDRRDWREALDAFREAVAQGGSKTDAALYWQAYTLGKLNRVSQAIEVLAELKKNHPDSRWVDDAKRLRAELRADVRPADEIDEDMKVIALSSLMQSDRERAMPLFEKFLQGDHSSSAKEEVLFLVLQSGAPEAMEIVVDVAKNSDDLELQAAAVRSIGIVGGSRSSKLLSEIYASAPDRETKSAVLESYMISSASERLLEIAREESDPTPTSARPSCANGCSRLS
jgi:tetratricopeptide (TPR) repeat protein